MRVETSEYSGEERRKDARVRRILGAGILIMAVILAITSVIGAFVTGPRDARQVSEQIRYEQYLTCEKVGNSLRKDIRDEFVDLKKDVLIPVFGGIAKLMPSSPSKEILVESVDYMKRRAATIDERIPDGNCLRIYPPLDGQTFPSDGG